MNIAAWVKRHPIVSYFLLAFGISWISIFLTLGLNYIRRTPAGPLDFIIALASMFMGPFLAGLILTRVVDGPQGMRELWRRMGKWRVGAHWYAAALLIVPALLFATMLALSRFASTAFTPGFLLLGVFYGLLAGFFEETGWTGFAYPRMRPLHGVLLTALILGSLHGLWHVFADYFGSIDSLGAYWVPHLLVQYGAGVTLLRFLIAWAYENTGSLLLAQLFHVSWTGSLVTFGPQALTPSQETLLDGAYAILVLLLVVLLIIRSGPTLVHRVGQAHAAAST